MYLALTGNRLTAKEVYDAHVATHFVGQLQMDELEKELLAAQSGEQVEGILTKYSTQPRAPIPYIKEIDRIFSKGSVREIRQALAEEKSEWAATQIKALDQASFFSLMLTHSLLQRGKVLDIGECLKMEFRASVRCMLEGDFYEGVRAKLVDKEKGRPNFRQDTFESFDAKRIQFAPDYLHSLNCPELDLTPK